MLNYFLSFIYWVVEHLCGCEVQCNAPLVSRFGWSLRHCKNSDEGGVLSFPIASLWARVTLRLAEKMQISLQNSE